MHVARSIRTDGWVPRKYHGPAHKATADSVFAELIEDRAPAPTHEDCMLATLALSWARNFKPQDHFEYQIHDAAWAREITDENIGYAAFIVKCYTWLEAEMDKYSIVNYDVHLGVPGYTMTTKVQVVEVHEPTKTSIPITPKQLVKLVDQGTAAMLVWGARCELPPELVPGAILHVSFKIKKHAIFRGLCQTEISHVKVLENN